MTDPTEPKADTPSELAKRIAEAVRECCKHNWPAMYDRLERVISTAGLAKLEGQHMTLEAKYLKLEARLAAAEQLAATRLAAYDESVVARLAAEHERDEAREGAAFIMSALRSGETVAFGHCDGCDDAYRKLGWVERPATEGGSDG